MRLWNAHRRVFHKRKLPLLKRLALKNEPNGWRQLLTEDVIKFIVDLEWYNLAGSQKEQEQRISTITRDPANYFSRPKNVPLELRTQIYLYCALPAFHLSLTANSHSVRPEFVVTFIRTPHLAPKYASFWVPLWFNKLDFKNYLKNVYNVDVLHIRSYVQQQKVQREERMVGGTMNQGQGRLYRPPARKKMTVELVDPFVYPEEEKDLSAYVCHSLLRPCSTTID